MSYTNGDIFETFPFPDELLENGDDRLEDLGQRFFQARQSYMEASKKGLTKFYNDFHDPKKDDPDLQKLRALQQEINQAVGRLYGWHDIDLTCGFHDVGYLPEEKNRRFTTSEESRLKVLRSLSDLNKERFHEKPQSGSTGRSPGTHGVLEDDLFAIGGGKA